jgi:hypothetical protein
LFIGYPEGIIVSVFFLTAAVVAASRADLTELSSGRWTFALLIIVVAALIIGISISLPQFSNIIFIPLTALNALLLGGYFFMRRASTKREFQSEESP